MLQSGQTIRNEFHSVKGVTPEMENTDYFLLTDWNEARNESSISELFKRNKEIVFRLSQRMVGKNNAEDVVQEVFLIVAKKAGIFDPRMGEVRSWIIGITIQACKQFIRSQSRRNLREEKYGRQKNATGFGNSKNAEVVDVLLDQLSQLPEMYRLPLELRYLDGMTVQETAKVLNVKTNTMQQRILRGMEKLRGQMGRYGISVSAAMCISLMEEINQESLADSLQLNLEQIRLSIGDDAPLSDNSSEQSTSLFFRVLLPGVAVGCIAIVAYGVYSNSANRKAEVDSAEENIEIVKGDESRDREGAFQYPVQKKWTFEKGIPADLLVHFGDPEIKYKNSHYVMFCNESIGLLSFAGEFSSKPFVITVRAFPMERGGDWQLGCVWGGDKVGRQIPIKGIHYHNYIKNEVTIFRCYFWENNYLGLVDGKINSLGVYEFPAVEKKINFSWKELNIISIEMNEIEMSEIPNQWRDLDDFVERNGISLKPFRTFYEMLQLEK